MERKGKQSRVTYFTSAESTMDWWLHGGSDSAELTLLDEMEENT